jgi:uncharacterized membrane protein
MHDARNVAPVERWLSLAAGGLLAVAALRRRGPWGTAAAFFCAGLLYRGSTGFCPMYAALGIDSNPPRGERNSDASVPYAKGVRVEQSILVARPAVELYTFWRRLETLAQFMEHVEEITVLTEERSRWRVHGPAGSRITWEAQIINDVPGRLIGWRSLPGSAMNHAGSVHFDTQGELTNVRVVMEYAPPARYVGASVARILGEEPHKQILNDLQRFKAIVERQEPANR